MPRPTPARLFYLIIGVILGAVILSVVLRSIPQAGLMFGSGAAPAPAATPVVFTGATLNRVLPVNAQADHNGASLRVNSLELYADGLRFTYAIISERTGPSARVLEAEAFTVTDDLGNVYTFSPFVSGSVPSSGYTTGYVAFSPSLSPEAQSLTIVVPHLLVVGTVAQAQPRVVDGPWEITVSVPR